MRAFIKQFLSAFVILTLAAGFSFAADCDITDGTGGNITARGENAPNETKDKAFDNSTSTKWLDFSPSGSWIQYRFTNSNTYVLSKYSITSANDFSDRDPADWQLLGSNDGTNWTTLDTRTAQTFSSRLLRREFTVSNTNAFSFFKLNITKVKSLSTATSVQLAEIELIGHVFANNPPTVETQASANPVPVIGNTCNLNVLGADDGGEANLTYTWATTGTPPGPVIFSPNGTNAAKNSTASFTTSGNYSFEVTIKDIPGLTVKSYMSVNVTTETQTCEAWDANTHYTIGDKVSYSGQSYECIVADVWYWPPTDTRYYVISTSCASPTGFKAPQYIDNSTNKNMEVAGKSLFRNEVKICNSGEEETRFARILNNGFRIYEENNYNIQLWEGEILLTTSSDATSIKPNLITIGMPLIGQTTINNNEINTHSIITSNLESESISTNSLKNFVGTTHILIQDGELYSSSMTGNLTIHGGTVVAGQSPARQTVLYLDGIQTTGTITAGQFKVGKWVIESAPDYVFAKGYDLRPLKDVKKFIDKNSHLPEVPSAKTINKDGLDLVEMNMTILKKVEELYLYTIQQDVRIEKLEKELKKFQK